MVEFDKLRHLSSIRDPEPEIPANPVPDPKKPTVSPGKFFNKPSRVDSPMAI